MPSSTNHPKPNTPYTRSDIQLMVGGEIQTYLPQKNRVILAGCFAIDANPNAPDEVQVGLAPKVKRKAVLLSEQPETVFPVFIKQERNNRHYQFCGNYKFKSLSEDISEIRTAEAASGRNGKLAYVLRLQKV